MIKWFWNFILLTISCFLAVHLFAILGPFLVLMYPVLVIFNPVHEPCLFCILRGRQVPCTVRRVFKTNKGIKIFIIDVLFLILASALSLGVLMIEKSLLERSNYISIPSKTAYMELAENGAYRIGEISIVPIKISGISTPINVVQADIQYDPLQIEIQDVLVGESFADIFIQKDIRNDLGFARVTGGIPNPGFSQESGIFAKLIIRCKSSGIGKISILPTSKVLANDGRGTNVMAEFNDHIYYVSQEELTLPELQVQEEYLANNVLGVSSSKFEFYNENITDGFEFNDTQEETQSNVRILDIAYKYITFVTDPVLQLF